MANPGVGTRFVSVNLNKSYGQSSNSNQSNYGSGRGRPGGHGGSGGGSGMVVLSRPRSSHKAGPKLSVPPPLNLPSLRKEHERFDSLGSVGGAVGGFGPGSGVRPTSSGAGWSKPSVITAERDGVGSGDRPVSSDGLDHGLQNAEGVVSTNAYMPPSARSGSAVAQGSGLVQMEKVTVLRGEDFPSLRATLAAGSGSSQKQKDSGHPKQRQGTNEVLSSGQRNASNTRAHLDMRPQVSSSQHPAGNNIGGHGGDRNGSVNSRPFEQGRKKEDYFLGPLPLVRLSPRSDWADDERDTSHGLNSRERDYGVSRTEGYLDMDFDFPRRSILPHKHVQNDFDRKVQRDNDIGKGLSNEVSNAGPCGRDVRMPSREGRDGNSWRNSLSRDGISAQEVVSDRNNASGRMAGANREESKESKYILPHYGGNDRDDYNGGITSNRDSAFGSRDTARGQGGRQAWKNPSETHRSWVGEQNMRDRYGSESNRRETNAVQNNLASKSAFSSSSKGPSISDPLLNFGREKRSLPRGEKPYVEDPFLKDWGSSGFDGQDPFSGSIIGLVKKKKDVIRQIDFHDPVRESFEAELERVQKMQEQERQRIIEEQERAMEMARREEEERQRLVREQEEHQRRMEEEAREAAWRAEQERLESIQKAEEHRIAREEEKRRMLMEEERRKQAAKQKLLELEERIAKRQAESAKADCSAVIPGDTILGVVKEKDGPRSEEFTSWEDGERMVERITNSASSSSSINRSFDLGSSALSLRDASLGFMDGGKSLNSWRRDTIENGGSLSFFTHDQDNSNQSPRRDSSFGGRGFPRKDFYGGAGYMHSRGYYRGGIPEPQMDGFPQTRGPRWNVSGDGDPYGRKMDLDPEFHENAADKFGDLGWGQGHARGNLPFTERLYQNSEHEELYSYGRLRYPARQPRVLPPPMPSMNRGSYRNESEQAISSTYEAGDLQYGHSLRSDATTASYDDGHQDRQEHSEPLGVQDAKTAEQELNRSSAPRCDSQSSLSVSSPPASPTHLSHDDLDASGDSPSVSAPTEGQDISQSMSESAVINTETGKEDIAPSSVSLADDEEWTEENNEDLQEQVEYDEDEGDYREEDEVHEGEDENVDLAREFEEMHLEGKSSDMLENLVLGFDQGVEVGMPNDEYERSPRNEESSYAVPQFADGIVEQQESFDSMRDGHRQQFADSLHVGTDNCSQTVQETVKAGQDLVSQTGASHTSTSSDRLNSKDGPSGSVFPAQQSVQSPLDMNFQSARQAVGSSAGDVQNQNQAEQLVKLHFGLFSGPSLIPSPVPAIQIGSIQMPLQLHPQVGPSLAHMHPSQPLFQFGQLRYPSPISQGILPLPSQSMSFIHPNVPNNFPLTQRPGGPLSVNAGQQSSALSSVKDDVQFQLNSQNIQPPNQLNISQNVISKEVNLVPGLSLDGNVLLQLNQIEVPTSVLDQARAESDHRPQLTGEQCDLVSSSPPVVPKLASESQLQNGPSSFQSVSDVNDSSGPTVQGRLAGGRGRRFAFTARNVPGPESSHSDSNGYQRRQRRGAQRLEFRVRQITDKKQSPALPPSNHSRVDARSNYSGKGTGLVPKGRLRKEIFSDGAKETVGGLEHVTSNQVITQETDSGTKGDNLAGKGSVTSGLHSSRHGEGSLKRNMNSEDDLDAPLQSGVVRVFKQPGIETPSDEDDFIEVRSKRQMLNDRREQREKEIKAKSNNIRKVQRKPHSAQGTAVARSTGKILNSLPGEGAHTINADAPQKRGLVSSKGSAGFNMATQPLAPIGTPTVTSDGKTDGKSQNIKRPLATPHSVTTTTGQNLGPDLSFEPNNKVLDAVQTSLGSWVNAQNNQQVMALTQTQLDEAMKPVRLDMHSASVGDHTSSVSQSSIPSSAVLAKNAAFSSATSPISSLLAGEKIQFGAVTSPTVLPPKNCAVSPAPTGSSRPDLPIPPNMSLPGGDSSLLYEKEKHSSESCASLEDSEAEAEAAASAVAVAAISGDEVVGNGMSTCSAAISCTTSFGATDIDRVEATSSMSVDPSPVNQSRAEETLSVSLPADLSVETPPISLWPPIPSPHSSSGQMISPFPGGLPSHFPFYDLNPMMGGPVFAFGPHEESSGTQSQPQKANASSSRPLGTWPQCHSGVDSFYGPPTGFTGPFISPPGPPHMVFYNHFAPVGQFTEVGLSYMGATYIPSSKQPDWKHNPAPSPMVDGEADMNNHMVAAARNPPNLSASVQHLAPGSPLLSMTSPLAMFDGSPFQSSPDMSIQPRWSHLPPSPLHSIAQSMPLQPQAEGAVPSQLTHRPTTHRPFPESQPSLLHSDGPNFSMNPSDPPQSSGPGVPSLDAGSTGSGPEGDLVQNCESTRSDPRPMASANKTRLSSHPKGSSGSTGYSYQRGSGSKSGPGSEWSNRKMGFHGRNHSCGERGFPPTKMKQIYVAKQSSTAANSAV